MYHIASQVARWCPRGVTHDDLVAAGLEGLAQAARTYDPARGATFSTFAAYRIRGAMWDDIRATDWASRWLLAKARRLGHTVEELTHSLGRTPKREEVARALGLTLAHLSALEADVHRMRTVTVPWVVTDDPTEGGEPVNPGPGPEDLIAQQEARTALWAAIESLPPRLRWAVERRFVDGLTLTAIGAEMGVTESRACQMCAEAVAILRRALVAYESGEPPPDELTARRARRRARKPKSPATPLAETA